MDTPNTPLPEPTAEDRARARFFTATTGQPPTDEQRAAVKAINDAVVALAVVIEDAAPSSRNKSLALTALEDVSMRANRAIFATGPCAYAGGGVRPSCGVPGQAEPAGARARHDLDV